MALKPRLECRSLTEDDQLIWRRIQLLTAQTYLVADRTDAALMWSMVAAVATLGGPIHERHQLLAFANPFYGLQSPLLSWR
jgi:hypothetical protein